MTEHDDELLRQFFAQHTPEIEDNGFSQKVMSRLPRRRLSANQLWILLCSLAGVVFLTFSNALSQLWTVLGNLVCDISGLVASIDLGNTSPLMIYVAVLTLVSVGAYNIMATR